METNSKNTAGKIVLFIFLLICSGLGIAAFVMSLTKKCGEGFKSDSKPTKANLKGNLTQLPTLKWGINDIKWPYKLALALIIIPYWPTATEETLKNSVLTGGTLSTIGCWKYDTIIHSFDGVDLRCVGYKNVERKEYLISIQGTDITNVDHDIIDICALGMDYGKCASPMSALDLAGKIFDQFKKSIPVGYKISLYGHSLGGLLAILAASKNSHDSRIQNVYTLNPWIGYNAFFRYFSNSSKWNKNIKLYIMYIRGDPASYMMYTKNYYDCDLFNDMLVVFFNSLGLKRVVPDTPGINKDQFNEAKTNLNAQLIELTDCPGDNVPYLNVGPPYDTSTQRSITGDIGLGFKSYHRFDDKIKTGYIPPADQWVNTPESTTKPTSCPCRPENRYFNCPCDNNEQCGSKVCSSEGKCYYSRCADERKSLHSLYNTCACDNNDQCGSTYCHGEEGKKECDYSRCADARKDLGSLYNTCKCDNKHQCGSRNCPGGYCAPTECNGDSYSNKGSYCNTWGESYSWCYVELANADQPGSGGRYWAYCTN